jgi:hypothetical protein
LAPAPAAAPGPQQATPVLAAPLALRRSTHAQAPSGDAEGEK